MCILSGGRKPRIKGVMQNVGVCKHKGSLWEAIGKSIAQVQHMFLEFWRCKYYGMATKNNSSSGVKPSGA